MKASDRGMIGEMDRSDRPLKAGNGIGGSGPEIGLDAPEPAESESRSLRFRLEPLDNLAMDRETPSPGSETDQGMIGTGGDADRGMRRCGSGHNPALPPPPAAERAVRRGDRKRTLPSPWAGSLPINGVPDSLPKAAVGAVHRLVVCVSFRQ